MNPPKHFQQPLTPSQRAAVIRRINAAELAEFRPEQWNAAGQPGVSEGTASAQRLQDAMRTGGLRLVPMGESVDGNARPRHAAARAQQQHRPVMTGDPYRLDDGIPVLRDAISKNAGSTSATGSFDVQTQPETEKPAFSRAELAAILLVDAAFLVALMVAFYLSFPWLIALISRAG